MSEGHRVIAKGRSGLLRIMSVVWFLAARTVERRPAVRQARREDLQNLPVEADRRSNEEFLECDEFRRLGL